MTSTPCAFCGRYSYGRFFICHTCDRQYSAQLGPGWEQSEWVRDFIKLHRQQTRADLAEQRRCVYVDTEALAAVADHTEAGLRRFEPRSNLLDGLVLDYGRRGFGSRKVQQLLKAQGWAVSREAIRKRLRRFRDAGLLPPMVCWDRKPLTKDQAERELRAA